MPSTKEYNVKLRSLQNTQKITKTMKMVSASKLRKAQQAQVNAKLYAEHLRHLICRVAASVDTACHPLLHPKDDVNKILILIFTSDKGLCGSFNHNVHKKVSAWLDQHKARYERVDLIFCGKRGYLFFHKKENVKHYYQNVTANPSFKDACDIGKDLSDSFISGDYDAIYVTHNQFFSPLSQITTLTKILPIDPQSLIEKDTHTSTDYLFEPETQQLLEVLIPHYLYFRIYFTLLENSAGEHGARMTAMDNATKNATEMIDHFTLLRNRARQAAITTELIEIVAGAEAL